MDMQPVSQGVLLSRSVRNERMPRDTRALPRMDDRRPRYAWCLRTRTHGRCAYVEMDPLARQWMDGPQLPAWTIPEPAQTCIDTRARTVDMRRCAAGGQDPPNSPVGSDGRTSGRARAWLCRVPEPELHTRTRTHGRTVMRITKNWMDGHLSALDLHGHA
jgi:hypothetical protein